MKKSKPTKSVRVATPIYDRALKFSDVIYWSQAQLVEKSVETIMDMCEHPEKRVVPEIVRMYDAVTRSTGAPLKSDSYGEIITATEQLKSAEKPDAYQARPAAG